MERTEPYLDRIPWKCPVCGQPLRAERTEDGGTPHTLRCPSRHSFDIARQGYVNLLLPNKRGASLPGDNTAMVRARTAFLEAGYYEGFSNGVNALCEEALTASPVSSSPLIADAGCGEGYYTGRLVNSLVRSCPGAAAVGFDLARDAVSHASAAAKRNGFSDRAFYAVASLFEMPVADGSVSGVVNLFAPAAEEEFARVLVPGGFFLMAVPAERHLFGLKQAVYDTPYENEVRRDVFTHFTLTDVRRISYTITLRTREDIAALFLMTPYYWKTSVSDRQKLDALDTLSTEVAFDLLLYRKNA